MDTSPSHVSRELWLRRCRDSSARTMERRGRILVVDDHEDNIELLRARLEAWGYEVEGARDGLEALERVHAAPPDLILLDVMMPAVDGNEVARRIKQNPALPFIPIFILTEPASTESKV